MIPFVDIIDIIGIPACEGVVHTNGERRVEETGEFVGRLDIECKVQTHIVGNTVSVAVGIIGHELLVVRVVILACWQRRRAAGGVVKVA